MMRRTCTIALVRAICSERGSSAPGALYLLKCHPEMEGVSLFACDPSIRTTPTTLKMTRCRCHASWIFDGWFGSSATVIFTKLKDNCGRMLLFQILPRNPQSHTPYEVMWPAPFAGGLVDMNIACCDFPRSQGPPPSTVPEAGSIPGFLSFHVLYGVWMMGFQACFVSTWEK